MPEQLVGSLKLLFDSTTGYVLFIFIAFWGGTAAYMSRLKRSGARFSLVELVGEWTISGFSGMVTGFVCHAYDVDYSITLASVGISGHMGSRLIFMLERYGQRYMEGRLGIKSSTDNE